MFFECEEIEKPAAGDSEVLIKVRAASVNPLDWRFLKGAPYIFRMCPGCANRRSHSRRQASMWLARWKRLART